MTSCLHSRRFAVLVSLVTLLVALPTLGQSSSQPPTFRRDPQAIAVLAQAFKALGGTVPPDSLASGTFARVSGSTSDTGSIQIMTRGYSQTAEKITAGCTTTSVVYSQGYSAQKNGSGTTRFSLERSLSSDSAMFPLITIAAAQDDELCIHHPRQCQDRAQEHPELFQDVAIASLATSQLSIQTPAPKSRSLRLEICLGHKTWVTREDSA